MTADPGSAPTAATPDALEEIATTREALRERARASLGVVGEEKASPFRAVCRRYELAYYPLIALSILYFTDGFQGYAFGVLAPDISRALGISIGAITAAVAADTLAVSLAPMAIAWLSQHGQRRALLCLVTAFAWSIITLFTGFVTALGSLMFILILDGLTTGSVTALHVPLVMDSYPPEARVRAVSRYSAAGFCAGVAGPLLVALLTGIVGLTWRGVFLAMGLTSVAMTLACLRLRDPGFGRWDTERVRTGVRDAKGETGSSTHAEEIKLGFWEVFHRLLMVPTLRRIFACFVLIGILSVPLNTYISFFLEQRWNLGATARGLFFGYYAACSAIALIGYGRRGERLFRRSPATLPRLAGVLLAIAVVFIALGGVMPSFAGMLICFGISGAALGPGTPALYISSMSIIPSRMRPHAQAMAGLFVAAGGFTGTVFYAGIDTRYGIDGAIVAVAIPGLIGAAVIATAGRHITGDLDRMIDEIVEDEEIRRIRGSGGHLPLLACRGLDFCYGQIQVLHGVDFTVDDGEMVALLGVNGAGKSTLLKAISGIGLPSAGSIRFHGADITYLDAERRLRLGIAQVPGGRAVFAPMTVAENLRCYGYSLRGDRRTMGNAVDHCFAVFPWLAERRNTPAAALSGGEQQMLGLAKALILAPRLLLIDELSLGLAPVMVGRLLEMVRAINDSGTAVVVVEQSVNIALSVARHAYFMEKGEIRFDGNAARLLERGDLLRAVFLSGPAPQRGAPRGMERRYRCQPARQRASPHGAV